jgi:hypothetical protein
MPRLRNDSDARRRAPDSAADERDCGADGGAGRRVVLGASDGRARRAAGGRAWRAARHSGRHRRRRGGRERRPNRRRLRRARAYLGHQCRPPAHAGGDPARECRHALLEPREPARGAEASRPDYRRGLCHRRAHADPHHARDAPHPQNGRGAGRCVGRPRRAGRNHSPDHPPRADLCGGRGGALRREQHAGRSRPHLHLRADQHHHALHPAPCGVWLARGVPSRPRAALGAEHRAGHGDAAAHRRAVRLRLHPPEKVL